MNKFFKLSAAILAFLFVGCSSDDPVKQSIPEAKPLFAAGTKVTNPMNVQWCKPAESEKTLASLRYVSEKNQVYYMDMYVNNDYQKEVDADLRDAKSYHDYKNEHYFTEEGKLPEKVEIGGSCSGFICHNEKGELLFCRNFDGSYTQPCVVLRDWSNGYYSVKFTAPMYYVGKDYRADKCLCNGQTTLHWLVMTSVATMDGMNEYGLCYAAYQLPDFDPDIEDVQPILFQNTGKKAITDGSFHNLLLGQCRTVVEAEALLRKYDFVNLHPYLNIHWLLADATGDWAVFEYWDNELHVYREAELKKMMNDETIPYEYKCIENYYYQPEPYSTYDTTEWQHDMTNKSRIRNMMRYYKPVMSEEEALICLQQGNYGIEEKGDLTEWSCVYNPTQRTILFNTHDDLSEIYSINMNE